MTENEGPKLRRSLGFWALAAYGVGDILGAGIYGLVGKVAGESGRAAWMSFAVAMGVAALTALTYSELVSRFPRSAGESYFSLQAFRRPAVSLLVGWLVFCSGVVSLSAVSHVFADHVLELAGHAEQNGIDENGGAGREDGGPAESSLAKGAVIVPFLLVLAGVNFWGIRESSAANIAFTIIEASGLLIVVAAGLVFLGRHEGPPPEPAAEAGAGWLGVFQGGILAFYAFIGFEDMVNVAEEVKSPERNFPVAIVTAVLVAGGMYVVVSLLATRVVPPGTLADARAPLVEVVQRGMPAVPTRLFTLIPLFAVANTGLLNYIMASRLVYGMSRQGLLPEWLGRIHPTRRTPHWAVLAILGVTALLTLTGRLQQLAGATSFLLLVVFVTVNISLLVVRVRHGRPETGFTVPLAIPVLGAMASFGLMTFVDPASLLVASVVVAVGAGLVLLYRLRGGRAASIE